MYRFGSVLGALSLTATLTLAQKIPQQKFLLTAPQPGTVVFEELMAGEIPGVAVHRVSLCGPAKHVEISDPDHDVILLILEGKGTLETNGQKFDLGDDTIVHVPLGWTRTLRVAHQEREDREPDTVGGEPRSASSHRHGRDNWPGSRGRS